jgi:TusA-related sulfurtransferase
MSNKIIVLSMVLLGLAACDEKTSATAAAPVAPPAASSTSLAVSAPQQAQVAPASSAVTVAASGNMAHCPNAVPSATTSLTNVEGGVELKITATDPAAVADIRARTKAILEVSKAPSAKKHDGNGGGGGPFGRCPVILRDTTIEAADLEGGARITVRTKAPAEIDWLRREASERAAQLQAPGSSGAGVRKMAHCPSAVDGAETKISDTPSGVTVTVTAKGDAVKDVRDRARKLVEISKREPLHGHGDGTHTGEGNGGGGIGRCPVVLRDTVVEEKDVEGGAQLSVKATSIAEVGMLQADSRTRAAKFQVVALAK